MGLYLYLDFYKSFSKMFLLMSLVIGYTCYYNYTEGTEPTVIIEFRVKILSMTNYVKL